MRFFFSIFFLSPLFTFQSCYNSPDPVSPENTLTENEALTQPAKQKIAPAFSDFDVATQKLTVQGSAPQTLKLPSGSSIDVPEAAFLDASGSPINGNVEIAFREFHDAAEIMACGIPMKVFAEGGHEAWMQTAGMYEINGTHNGKPVFIAPGKALNVNLVSDVDGEYDFWKFEPNTGNWDNLGVSTPQQNPNSIGEKVAMLNIGLPPAAPIAFNENTPPIDLDVNLENFPELANKKGIVWQFCGKNKKMDPANNPEFSKKTWDEIDLKPNKDNLTYNLTLSNDEEKVTLPVAPTLKGKDLEQALADYKIRLADYQKKIASVEEENALKQNQSAFIRSFKVQGFGIYNYDILMKMGTTIPLLANFDFGTDIPLNLRKDIMVFLVSANGRMIVKFPPTDWNKFRIDPTIENSLVAILPGNKLATLSNEELQAMMPKIKAAKGQEFVFQMNPKDQPVKSVEDVQDRLAAL